MLRLLFFFLLAYFLISILRSYLRRAHLRARGGADGRDEKAEEMALDPQCRAYVPKSQAVLQEGNYFCSRECARLYLAR